MPSNVQVTTPLVWVCTGILFMLDSLLVLLDWRVIHREAFLRMRWVLVIAASAFFFLVWTVVLIFAWDWFYSYIFPAQLRIWLPVLFGLLYALIAYAMGWLSLKLPANPAVTWCLLGGVEGLLSHLFAIYGLGAASAPPIMRGSDPFAVLIFAVFEKMFYWSLLLLGCKYLWNLHKARQH